MAAAVMPFLILSAAATPAVADGFDCAASALFATCWASVVASFHPAAQAQMDSSRREDSLESLAPSLDDETEVLPTVFVLFSGRLGVCRHAAHTRPLNIHLPAAAATCIRWPAASGLNPSRPERAVFKARRHPLGPRLLRARKRGARRPQRPDDV